VSARATGQLGPLIALRWRMVRSRRARLGFGLLASAIPALCTLAAIVGVLAPRQRSLDVQVAAPTAYLSVAVLALLAPLVAGGGNELFPAEQLVAFPVTARTQYVASLALTPLNLAWTTQLVALVGLTTYIVGSTPWLVLGLVMCLAYFGAVSVAGQALAWAVVGVRQRRRGRQVTWAIAAVATAALLTLLVMRRLTNVLDNAPTQGLVNTVLLSRFGPSGRYWTTLVALLVVSAATFLLGRRTCAWALRRPGDAASRIDVAQVRRRPNPTTVRRTVLALDRASVWRSPSLRRGLLVLAVLPGLVAASAGLEWPSLVLLPGLVAAGAGLLFGVNAFCLDGSGIVWLASLPVRPAVAYWCKAQVIAETCLVAIVLTLACGVLRTGRAPTATEAVALGASGLIAILRVLALCLELSIGHPHRADLRGPRDTPAPPGVMAAYSARLALTTTVIAVVFSALAQADAWQWPAAVALPFLLLSIRRLLASAREWEQPAIRARVVATVASG
jgi:hypothetical protein